MSVNNITIQMPNIIVFPDGRLDTKNAVIYLGIKEKTLAMKRSNGTGPCFIKRDRISYFKEDLDHWVQEAARCKSTAQLQHFEKEVLNEK